MCEGFRSLATLPHCGHSRLEQEEYRGVVSVVVCGLGDVVGTSWGGFELILNMLYHKLSPMRVLPESIVKSTPVQYYT